MLLVSVNVVMVSNSIRLVHFCVCFLKYLFIFVLFFKYLLLVIVSNSICLVHFVSNSIYHMSGVIVLNSIWLVFIGDCFKQYTCGLFMFLLVIVSNSIHVACSCFCW